MSGYLAESVLVEAHGARRLLLESGLGATPQGLVENPSFFHGFAARPDVVSSALLAVADVAASRYYDAGFRLSDVVDPVMTAGGDRLRCESFSACNGVQARLDLLGSGLDGGEIGFGTTNVDINSPLRSALANVHRNDLLHFDVGRDRLVVSTPEESHVERKVDLPDRWVRGFAETPAIAAGMTHLAAVSGSGVSQFLASLPAAQPGRTVFLLPSARGLREVAAAKPSTVTLAGTGRLAAARRVARFATRLDIFRHDNGASGWVFRLPGADFTLLLSPAAGRGFSGEGGILAALAAPGVKEAGATVLDFLGWQAVISIEALRAKTCLSSERVSQGLAWLGASGKVGFDLVEDAYFHRELPLDPGRTVRDHPRLQAARGIVARGGVSPLEDCWDVLAADGKYAYRVTVGDGLYQCTCAWWYDFRGSRGPCKHALAVQLLRLETAPGHVLENT
ncbi:SWIM zinc finger family protein [Arthrobacter humicola]|uniref:SWIM zinc finger domain-containing protein n=1 Tax=Arthrobacter humicola TaxID=409291 RepID=A0ABN2YSX3_9MICC